MEALARLDQTLSGYLTPEQSLDVKRAFFYAEQAHYGQTRRSGDPYVTHPLAVANILAEMHMDPQSIMAGLLHDVIEDTGVSKEALAGQFGETVAELVDGVSKLTQIEFNSLAEKQAENFQKMALAMARDIRVILVKLADRLHNMRTLGVLNPEKSRRIARETLEIYAPIAMRLGMNTVRMEFEDLGFKALHPMRCARITAARAKARGHRKELVENIRSQIEAALHREGHSATVTGREKHLYSIYLKMKEKRKSFSEIMDIYAFRIIVDSVDTCYRVLGCVHSIYKPVPGEFTDYIAMPKANGYQSLHTVLRGMHGVPIEIQIRTREMEDMANNGIAAHWLYKSDDKATNVSQARARKWVQGLLEMQQRAGDSMEFIDSVKKDLFPDEVYVFTPKGKIFELPRGSTPVDFAYAVHTDIGNSCVSCRIDRRLAPLSEPLSNGQTVEIITTPRAQPNMAWLNFVVTGKARTAIRHFLKNQQQHESVELGRRLLNQFLASYNLTLDQIDPAKLDELLKGADLKSLDALLEDIGMGNRMAYVVARMLQPDPFAENSEAHQDRARGAAVAIRGAEGMVMHYARCCHPIPGDGIIGNISTGRGLVVHRSDCRNHLKKSKDEAQRNIYLEWSDQSEEEYPVVLQLQVESQRGVIAQLAMAVSAAGANLLKVDSGEKDGQMNTVTMELTVLNRVHLARVMKKLKAVRQVTRVSRQ